MPSGVKFRIALGIQTELLVESEIRRHVSAGHIEASEALISQELEQKLKNSVARLKEKMEAHGYQVEVEYA